MPHLPGHPEDILPLLLQGPATFDALARATGWPADRLRLRLKGLAFKHQVMVDLNGPVRGRWVYDLTYDGRQRALEMYPPAPPPPPPMHIHFRKAIWYRVRLNKMWACTVCSCQMRRRDYAYRSPDESEAARTLRLCLGCSTALGKSVEEGKPVELEQAS